MVNHFGERTNSGHYTATTKNLIDNCWRTFDDTKVGFTKPHDICYSTNAYLLFYERRRNFKQQQFTASSWYPNAIPKEVIQMYTNVCNENGNDVMVSGGSTFYVNENELENSVAQRKTFSPQRRNYHLSSTDYNNKLNNNNRNGEESSPIRSKSYQTLSNNNHAGEYYSTTKNDYTFKGHGYY